MRSSGTSWRDAPTSFVGAAGEQFAVRHLGDHPGIPLVLLTHLGANLDNWDPAVVEALAAARPVVTIDYRGVGASSGRPQERIEDLAADMVAVIAALGHTQVDLFGLSMGGMVVQAMQEIAPDLARRVVIAGAAPRHGDRLTAMTAVALSSTLRAALRREDPKQRLFFTDSPAGRSAAASYLQRLSIRTMDRDLPVLAGVFTAQLRAVRRWGRSAAPTAPLWTARTLILHGADDRMVPAGNATALHRLVPGSVLRTYPDTGHGVVFQHADTITADVIEFLAR